MEFLKGVYHFILVVIRFATRSCGKAITCTAGDFAAGEVGFFMCYFPDDIDAHHSVFVQYYPFSAPTDASDETGTVSVGTLVRVVKAVLVAAVHVAAVLVAAVLVAAVLVAAVLVVAAVVCIITVVTLFRPRRRRLLGMEFLKGVSPSILVVIMLATPTCGKAITCTAGDFAAGEVGFIMCYFPDDIDAHHSVFVQYYPFSAPTDASATGVLHCKTEDVKASNCNEQNGYVLKSHTRNTLVVEVVNITEKAAGRYNCQFLPPDHSPREMCSLTVRAKTTGVTPAGEVDRDSDVLVEGNDSSTKTVHPDETGTVSVGTLVGVIVAAVVCIIVVFVFRLRRRRSPESFCQFPHRHCQTKHTADRFSQTVVCYDARPVEKRSMQTQVTDDSLHRAFASPLIYTDSFSNKTPAQGITGPL